MFFTVIGILISAYSVTFTLLTFLSDCDLQLKFYEKFGKSPSSLKGKVVLITGASSGIGEYTAYALAKFGVKLVLTARRNDELLRVKKKCIEISGGLLDDRDVLAIPADITDFQYHRMLFQWALDYFGRVDILVNNAGRSQRALWENIELAVDKQMFDLNVFAVVNLTRKALEYFNEIGTGHVAVVSSMAGLMGAPNSATYSATKHALHGYFNALRTEKIEENIDVTILCPGPTFSNFLQESFTGIEYEKYKLKQQATDKCMSTERCGYLIAVALANKTKESWIINSPLLALTYIRVYFPIIFGWGLQVAGRDRIFKIREHKCIRPF